MNNNQSFNYKLVQAEALLQQILTDLPVGVAYYLLNAKTQELKKLYYEQAEREMAAAAQESNQTSPEKVQAELVE